MGTVTGLTAARMEAIEAASVVDGHIDEDGHLILEKFDESTIDAGSVIGPTGSPGISDETLEDALNDYVPIGVAFDYVGTTAPNAKWLLMQGQSIAGANASYPDFWAKIPASWKSGTTLLMPDARGKMAVCYNASDASFDVIGETGGTKTVALTQAELPVATISINPPSTAVTGSVGNDTPDHIHGVNINSSLGLDDNVGSALLEPYGYSGYEFVVQHVGGGSLGIQTYAASNIVTSTPYVGPLTPDISHYHNVLGNTAGASARHTHPAGSLVVDIAAFNSSPLGSGDAHNNLPPYITFQKIIKVL